MKKHVQIAAGVIIGGLLLWWLFRETEWAKVAAAIRDANWSWLLLAEALLLLTFATRVQRWVYIVRSAKPVRWSALFSATQIGFLGNFVLPGRVGEVIRAVVLGRLAKLPFSQCFAFVALDRVTDLFGLIAMMLVAALAFRPTGDIVLPPDILSTPIPANAIRMGAMATTAVVLIIITGFVLIYLNKRLLLRVNDAVVGFFSRKIAGHLHQMISNFSEGMHVLRSWSDMSLAIFYSLITWLIGVAHYGCLLYAFGMSPPWYVPFVVMALLAVAISLPSTPGFAGVFHAGIIGAVLVTMPDADVDVAKAAAIVAHLLNVISVVAVGLYCLYREDFGLIDLQREGKQVEEALVHDDVESAP